MASASAWRSANMPSAWVRTRSASPKAATVMVAASASARVLISAAASRAMTNTLAVSWPSSSLTW